MALLLRLALSADRNNLPSPAAASCVHVDSGVLHVVNSNQALLWHRLWPPGLAACWRWASVAVGETVILLLHPTLQLVGVSTWTKMGCQQNDSLADG